MTTIGSAPDADLRLDGLAERHAEIRRNAADEFYLVQLSPVRDSFVNGKRTDGRHLLRTSMRIEFADWTLSYYREEYADHGRPYGGRVGGEIGHQRPQEPREPIRTSPSASLWEVFPPRRSRRCSPERSLMRVLVPVPPGSSGSGCALSSSTWAMTSGR